MDAPATLAQLFEDSERRFGKRTVVYTPTGDGWSPITSSEMAARRRRITAGLFALGVARGDRVAILSETRFEFVVADAAALSLGGIVVGVYPTLTAEQAAYILAHSESRVCFVDNAERARRVLSLRQRLPALETIISFDDVGVEGVVPLASLEERGAAELARDPELTARLAAAVQPDDVATFVYTSGTTADPKGVVLAHGSVAHIARLQADASEIDEHDVGVAFLPLAHALTRVAGYSAALVGLVVYFARSLDELSNALQAAQPSILAGVPRVFEKVHAKIMNAVEREPAIRGRLPAANQEHIDRARDNSVLRSIRQAMFRRAIDAGVRYSRALQRGERAPLALVVERVLWERLLYSKLRARTFGRRAVHIHSGGAPLARELMEFFHAIGVLVLEGYGLTETCSPATMNTSHAWRFGTVGRPLPGVEIKIAGDGEVLIKGPGVFREYYKDAAATEAAFTDDGWFKSGDIGALDGDGFLSITDRKKDLIITAGGKNIPPQPIENKLKERRGISQAMVYGDKKPYLVALLTLDDDALRGLDQGEREGLVARAVDDVNAGLAKFETVKRWRVLERDFSVDDGTLTPSLKVKRRAVTDRYRDEIEALYREG